MRARLLAVFYFPECSQVHVSRSPKLQCCRRTETQARSQNQKINTRSQKPHVPMQLKRNTRALQQALQTPARSLSPLPPQRPRSQAARSSQRRCAGAGGARHGGCCRRASLPLQGDCAHTQPGPAPRFLFTPGPAGGWRIVSKDLGTVGGVSPPLPCPGYPQIHFLQRFSRFLIYVRVPSLAAQRVKNPAVQETWVGSLGQEEPLEKEVATHSSILAWRVPWTEEPGGLPSIGSQRVRHD